VLPLPKFADEPASATSVVGDTPSNPPWNPTINCLLLTSTAEEPVSSNPNECVPSDVVTVPSNANTVFEPYPAPTGIGDKKCALSISLESIEKITPGVILSEPLSGDEYLPCPNGPAVTGNEPSTLHSTLTYLERFT